jgi:hypothetical protein
LFLIAAGVTASCRRDRKEAIAMNQPTVDPATAIRAVEPLGFPWQTRDPFLFCVHHDDRYPQGNEQLGPRASLEGRDIGQDFVVKDGWRMYHGTVVPGFPQHPHRGFETISVVRQGLIDHSDSMGAAGRYGRGDTQWMTAGAGVLHAEMFPLLDSAGPNPLELFQIWLNLPKKSKMVEPHFKMMWAEQTPQRELVDERGRTTRLTIVAGTFEDAVPPAPPPDSWASQPDADVAVWTIEMDAHARFTLPAGLSDTNRTLYLYSGSGLRIGSRVIPGERLIELKHAGAVPLESGAEPLRMLLLQGRPIREPVVQHGPFVMNSKAEIAETIRDYQRTRFGGWPWSRDDQVHPRESGRFARHADGHIERPG